jgi:predicted RNA binding protein YcfA (HicA-like mRNA interferase family)
MSSLPRPTGKDLIEALQRISFVVERTKGSHYFLRHPDGRATVVPYRSRTLGLGLLRKVMADCGLKSRQLEDLL